MSRFVNKRWLAGSLLGLTFFSALWVYLQANQAKDATDIARRKSNGLALPVRTAQATETQIYEVIGATAVTIPSDTVEIRIGPSRGLTATSPISDLLIKTVRVKESDRVRKGQVLFEIDDEVVVQVVKQQEIAHRTAKAKLDRVEQTVAFNEKVRELDLLTSQANLVYRKTDLAIREKLDAMMTGLGKAHAVDSLEQFKAESEKVAARFQFSEAERLFQRAQNAMTVGPLRDKAEVAEAQSEFEKTRIDLESARRDVERRPVKTPLDGVLGPIPVVPGSLVMVTTELTRVLNLDPIHVRLDFPQERVDAVAVGQKADIVLDSFPQETFTGTVVRISPQVNTNLRVLPVLVELPNPDHRIKAGISGYVRVRVPRKATTVPSEAVLQQGGKAIVFKVEDGRAWIREVRTGTVGQDGVQEILEGVSPGDEVVIYQSNFYKNYGRLTKKDAYLQDGDPVDPNWRKWARRE